MYLFAVYFDNFIIVFKMERIKLIFLLATIAVTLSAQKQPDALNVNCEDGRIVSALFDKLERMEITEEDITIVGNESSKTVLLDNVSKITFGDYITDITYPVIFEVLGDGEGTLSASVETASGWRDIVSGEVLPDGSEVLFTATPSENYKVKGWRSSGHYTEYGDNSILMTVSGESIEVFVEFEEINTKNKNIISDDISVYVNEYDGIIIECSTCCIEHVKVIGTGGNLVRMENCGAQILTIPTEGMVSGVYVLKIYTEKGEEIRKIIIK